MKKDYFYDVILSKYLEPSEENVLFKLMEIENELNNCLTNQKKITYREYIDILHRYFKNADHPGCFWDILDDSIPVRMFTWDCSEGYSNMKKVGDKYVFDEKNKFYTWILKPIDKRKAV